MDATHLLTEKIRSQTGLQLVVTGAGVSLASGIPTFRGNDPDAVWQRDVTELGTYGYFRAEPEGSWAWYLKRFAKVFDAAPNPAHHALVDIENFRRQKNLPFLLVTQNIDGLHRQAGSVDLVEVHGRADRVRCATSGCRHGSPRGSIARADVAMEKFMAAPTRANVPRCPLCNDFLRQHVLWFDEMYTDHEDYNWQRVIDAASSATTVVFVGTSFSVGVTDLILTAAARRHVAVFNIDPFGQSMPGVHLIREPVEQLLPAVVELLR